jgi:hypothetical protein
MFDNMPDERDWALLQVIQNPVLFREFINEDDPNWQPLEPHERAWTSSTAQYLSMCCGRGVRKTTAMIELLYYWVINKMYIPGDPGLLVYVPNKAQKDAIFPRVRQACEQHWLIKFLVNSNKVNVQEGRIEFHNGFTFILRIAGSEGKESNVISIHTSRIWVDEAQSFPWLAWKSLGNVLKFDIPGHMMWVSGVPNGERKDNVLYTCDQLDDKYVSFNIPQTKMSWWNPDLEYQRRREYNALLEDSEDYKHYVLGQHGVPTYSIFDRIRFKQEDYEVLKIVLAQHNFDNTKRVDIDGVQRYHINEVAVPPPVPYDGGVKPLIGLGYDVGYSPDPAVFFVLYQDRYGQWKCLARFVLQRVEYALQREFMAYLDTIYQFDFLGIDMGGPGKVQYQDLAGELTDFKEYKYLERLFPVEFGSYMVVAIDEDGVEKKDQTKRVSVETLSRWVHEHRFVFSREDSDLMDELERTKFTRTMTGEPVYKTDDDHQMAAMMCAIMAYENKFGPPVIIEKPEIKPKLIRAGWLDTTREGIGAYGR